ncbi:hypothetical protein CBM2617_A200025 [Cupriavidus taiwanensis]|nr:hypothetical protein CBM2617_A200025 [Cupriavidus taiwanensis]
MAHSISDSEYEHLRRGPRRPGGEHSHPHEWGRSRFLDTEFSSTQCIASRIYGCYLAPVGDLAE